MVPQRIQSVKERFQQIGIRALYGGGNGKRGKGHGFWLAAGIQGNTCSLRNDGQRSGNEWFWMWSDAIALLEKLERPVGVSPTSPHGFAGDIPSDALEGAGSPGREHPQSAGAGEQRATAQSMRQVDLFCNL